MKKLLTLVLLLTVFLIPDEILAKEKKYAPEVSKASKFFENISAIFLVEYTGIGCLPPPSVLSRSGAPKRVKTTTSRKRFISKKCGTSPNGTELIELQRFHIHKTLKKPTIRFRQDIQVYTPHNNLEDGYFKKGEKYLMLFDEKNHGAPNVLNFNAKNIYLQFLPVTEEFVHQIELMENK